jgi:hypothetical protein
MNQIVTEGSLNRPFTNQFAGMSIAAAKFVQVFQALLV